VKDIGNYLRQSFSPHKDFFLMAGDADFDFQFPNYPITQFLEILFPLP